MSCPDRRFADLLPARGRSRNPAGLSGAALRRRPLCAAAGIHGPAVGPPAATGPSPVRTAQVAPPKPVVRGQAPDDYVPPAKPAPIAMPSPEQLGVAARSADGGCDWTAIHRRMQDLGVTSFQMDRPDGDIYQFTCLLPTAEAGRTHRIEGRGATQAEAVRRALAEAQRWREQGR